MEKSLRIFDFKPHEIIASVGASGGVWEIYFTSQIDNLTFYVQDIDETLCNEEEIKEGIVFYEKFLEKPIHGKLIPVIGTEKKTNLPENTFDKVLIINSFHEFKYPKEILLDISKTIRKEGVLFIEEQLASYEGEIHEGCLRTLYLENELVDFVEKQGFVLNEIIDKANKVKVFSFYKR